MVMRPMFRLVPDNLNFHYMRGRFLGLAVSAVLSIASVCLFFYPGLSLGIDFNQAGLTLEKLGIAGMTPAQLLRFVEETV